MRRADPARRADGERGETLAAAFLERHGLAIVARNVRNRFGEIDIVARDGATLVFVEVRLRRSQAFGGAAASIAGPKRARLARAASCYLATLDGVPPCRFDAVLLDGLDAARIEWLRDVLAT
ncbi:MAG: YraN family protein [Burkholderiales bacterium]|nr:YraN family protein [Burkholderiales bacterium]